MTPRILIWNENVHERTNELVRGLYPQGIHGALREALLARGFADVATVTLQDPEHGLTEARLAATDVLVWWGHKAHGEVSDAAVERVALRVWQGMGLIVLHSGHFSKIFKRLMGTPCALKWREAGEIERLWCLNPGHPIAAGLPPYIEIPQEEMYGEPFSVPEPLETLFISWFAGGEVFRSGMTWLRGAGRIFYFRPGHEAYPTYHNAHVQQVIANAARWAFNPAPAWVDVTAAPNVPAEAAPSPLKAQGARLHGDGEQGYR
ncbi:MAG: ThuA domain-containing protein [Hyphomicrobiales bacterium]|nr:ThuA domain-containing protein [Hyphomicrobiales bacterium]